MITSCHISTTCSFVQNVRCIIKEIIDFLTGINNAIVDIRLRPQCAIQPPVKFAICRGIRLARHVSQKLPFPLLGSSPPCNTLFLKPSPLIIPNAISIGSSCTWSMGKKGFRHVAGVDILTDRQTDTHRHTHYNTLQPLLRVK